MKFLRKNEKGQAYVETIIVVPVLLLFIAGIVYCSQITGVQRRLLMAARYGAWLYARGQEKSVVKDAVISFLIDPESSGSMRLDRSKIKVECKPRWSWGDVTSLGDFTEGMNDRVIVSYRLGTPALWRFLIGERSTTLEEKCVVAGGTWYWGFPMW
jgi:Flp pilus assembly protein TadG